MDPERLKIFKRTTYWKETNAVVKACVEAAERSGMTMTEFALRCDLSPATVNANYSGDIGLPQQLTLWKLCAGAGFKLEATGRGGRLAIDSEMAGIRAALDRKPRKAKAVKRKGGGTKKGRRKRRNG